MRNRRGKRIKTAGKPAFNQSVNSIPRFAAVIPFGGLPTRVPIPPTLAE